MAETEDLVRFHAGGLDWTVERPFAEAVRAQIASCVNDVPTHPGVEQIKRNMVRAVYRVPFDLEPGPQVPDIGPRVIMKRYAVGGLVDWVKYCFKPSRAAAEWHVGRGLTAAGVPTAVPLAMAELRRGGVLRDAALLTREIPDAVHLNAFVEAHLQGSARADELRGQAYARLAQIVRRMHDAGFVHNDLHGGNILFTGAPEAPDIRIIDLHSVVGPGRSSESVRWFDLVKLLHSMLTCSTPDERLDLIRAYAVAGDSPKRELERGLANGSLAPRLEKRLAAMEVKRVRSRTVRCLDRSSRFQISRVGGRRVHHLRELEPAAIRAAVEAHENTMFEGEPGEILKDARRSALTRQLFAADPSRPTVIVKEFLPGGVLDRVKNLLRRPRAVSAWLGGNGLLVRAFDVAEPLALVRGGRLSGSWFLLMEDLGERSRLDLVALESFAGELDAEQRAAKHALLRAAGDVLQRLHARGVYHGDLKAVNLFVRATAQGPSIALADYDRVEFGVQVSDRRRVKNLGQLSASLAICITLADRLRFFRHYAANEERVLDTWKEWFHGVVTACRRKIVVEWEPIE